MLKIKVLILIGSVIGCLRLSAQIKDSAMLQALSKVPPFMLFGKRSEKLVLSLETLHVKDEVFWFRFSLKNKSGLSYPVDLFRLYIHDKNHAARSSQQEVELLPVYTDTIRVVPAHSMFRFFIGLQKFTIPDNKVCLLEMFETNGGRNLSLEITNRQLFLARPVEEKQIKVKR